ncbi:DUF4012 domain-containing protein [bacterium]|nr:DUF4012 domain-containing protein [bacterium]
MFMNLIYFLRKSGDKDVHTPRRVLMLLVGGVLIALLVLGMVWGGRLGIHAWSAYEHAQALREVAGRGINVQSLLPVQRELDGLAEDTRILARGLAPLLGSAAEFRFLGMRAGDLLAYLDAGQQTAALAADFLAIVRATSADPTQPLTAYLLQGMAEQATALSLLGPRAQATQSAILTLDPSALPPDQAAIFASLQPLAHFLEPAMLLSPTLSTLLGYTEPARYLVLVQNNQEARATGGFISSVALATVVDGALEELVFSDSYAVDNLAVAHPAAPPAMQRYLDAPLIFFRDTNWSPHFPISARTAQAVYARDQGIEVDGVISVDLRAVELALQAMGPIAVSVWDAPISAGNALEVMMALWTAPATTDARIESNIGDWWLERKSFMGLLAEGLLAEMQFVEAADLAAPALALHQALSERAIQVWIEDGLAAQHLAQWGWDGGLRAVSGIDYLSIVDSNVGFNKVNAVVERSTAYDVNWSPGGGQGAQATVTVTYTHPIEMPGHLCNRRARYGDTYQEMMRRCYFNYVRIYTPRGSELQSTSGLEDGSQESQPGEASTTVFAGYFVLKPGESHTIQFTYRLPAEIQLDNYRLILQRQSGSAPLPIAWDINGIQGEAVITENWVEKRWSD